MHGHLPLWALLVNAISRSRQFPPRATRARPCPSPFPFIAIPGPRPASQASHHRPPPPPGGRRGSLARSRPRERTMTVRALQYRSIGRAPEVVTVPDPEPGPGQILLKVTAAGVCHSDLHVMELPGDRLRHPLPLTLGHEGAGTVAALGAGVTGWREGDAVAVYGAWGCGLCGACAAGRENYCPHAAGLGIFPPGLGAPGAMAEYLLIDDRRHLVALVDLDPVLSVPLTDAGLTPYHAIKRALPSLVPGAVVVVIGAGGLGHVGIQLVRALSPARV